MWTLTYSAEGERHVEFIPEELLPILLPLAKVGREYRDAVAEVLTINARLVSLGRMQKRMKKKTRPALKNKRRRSSQ